MSIAQRPGNPSYLFRDCPMLVYWTIYLLPLLSGLTPGQTSNGFRRLLAVAYGLLLLLMIGTRHKIGCDWPTYLALFESMDYETLSGALVASDPGYGLLNWVCFQLGLGIYAVNTVLAGVFVVGLTSFCQRQPLAWLAYVVAIPYFVVVVSMGYSRQATALGFLMLALNALGDRSLRRYMLFVLLAALFHKTAVVFAFLAIVGRGGRVVGRAAMASLSGAALVVFFLLDSVDALRTGYIEQEYASQGGAYRIVINAVAAIILLAYRNAWRRLYNDFALYLVLAIAALVALPMIPVSPVGADRMALYLLPFQIAVYSRVPQLLGGRLLAPVASLAVAMVYGVLLYVWLNYAEHAFCWVPYESAIF